VVVVRLVLAAAVLVEVAAAVLVVCLLALG